MMHCRDCRRLVAFPKGSCRGIINKLITLFLQAAPRCSLLPQPLCSSSLSIKPEIALSYIHLFRSSNGSYLVCNLFIFFSPQTLSRRLQRGWGCGDIPALTGKAPRATGNPNRGSSAQSHPQNLVLKHKSIFQGTTSLFFLLSSAVSHKIGSITGF